MFAVDSHERQKVQALIRACSFCPSIRQVFPDVTNDIHTLIAGEGLTRACVPPISARSSVCPVEAPGVLNFEACCVGVAKKQTLTLTNPTDKWMDCTIQVHPGPEH